MEIGFGQGQGQGHIILHTLGPPKLGFLCCLLFFAVTGRTKTSEDVQACGDICRTCRVSLGRGIKL